MGGDLIHELIGLAGVQDAREAAHLAIHPELLFALRANLFVPVVVHARLPVHCASLCRYHHMVTPLATSHLPHQRPDTISACCCEAILWQGGKGQFTHGCVQMPHLCPFWYVIMTPSVLPVLTCSWVMKQCTTGQDLMCGLIIM